MLIVAVHNQNLFTGLALFSTTKYCCAAALHTPPHLVPHREAFVSIIEVCWSTEHGYICILHIHVANTNSCVLFVISARSPQGLGQEFDGVVRIEVKEAGLYQVHVVGVPSVLARPRP